MMKQIVDSTPNPLAMILIMNYLFVSFHDAALLPLPIYLRADIIIEQAPPAVNLQHYCLLKANTTSFFTITAPELRVFFQNRLLLNGKYKLFDGIS